MGAGKKEKVHESKSTLFSSKLADSIVISKLPETIMISKLA